MRKRLEALDALRGFLLVPMALFNWSFLLSIEGVFTPLAGSWWYWWFFPRVVGAGFIFIAGVSSSVSLAGLGFRAALRKQFRRFAFLSLWALAITVATWVFYPEQFIFFGILHLLAAASLLAPPFARRPYAAVIAGIAVLSAGWLLPVSGSENLALASIGLAAPARGFLDFFPLIPWAGFYLLGFGFGKKFEAIAGERLKLPGVFSRLGRSSLALYLLHQPLLWLLLAALK